MVGSTNPHMYIHVIHGQELTLVCLIISLAICLTWALRDLFQKWAAEETERKRLNPKNDYPIFPGF